MSEISQNTLIFDLGTYETIFGIAGQDNPQGLEKSITADSNNPLILNQTISGLKEMAKERFFGNDAQKYKDLLKLVHFIEKKEIPSIIGFLRKIMEDYFWDPSDCNLICLPPPNFLPMDLMNLKHQIFTQLHIPKLKFLSHSLCALTALNQTTGTIIDIGYNSTRVESIFKGFPNDESRLTLGIGGKHITNYYTDAIFPKIQFSNTAPLTFIAEEIKRAMTEILGDPNEIIHEINQGSEQYDNLVELPDGSQFTINREKFEAGEIFFKPELAHIRDQSLPEAIISSIRSWERVQVPEFLKNIVLCGNGGKIRGLREKLQIFIKESFPQSLDINIIEIPQLKEVFWIGASIYYNKHQNNMEWDLNEN